MIGDSLVSVLTPCYNAERYIHRLLESVLSQTYPNIHMIVIDDGSTDSSAEIIKSYIPKFKERNFKLDYIYQTNQGQSVAINKGLKLVDGDYLVWPDSDDFYANDTAIEQMVEALEGADDMTSMVRVQYNVLDKDAGSVLYRWGVDDESRYKTDLFEDYLFNSINTMWAVPGGYMARVSKLDELMPKRSIYTEKGAGQNFQIMLPLLCRHKCITIEKYLYNVVDRPDSHSRDTSTAALRSVIYKRTVASTLNNIQLSSGYRKYLLERYRRMLESLDNSEYKVGTFRFAVKRIVKAIAPYGLVMLYKRSC